MVWGNAIDRFAELVAGPDPPALDEAALAIAAGADATLDAAVWLEELDRLAAGVTDRESLVRRLFVERGFAGNAADYADPDNSLLHRVLQRRLGIPITLAVVMLEVGRRAGVALEGVSMPGHFLIRDPETSELLDPFDGGRVLDEAAAEARFRATTGAGPDVAFTDALLAPAGTLDILDRMLANLAGVFRRRAASRDLEWVVRMRLALPEAPGAAAVELGEALAMRGRFREAAAEVEARAGGDHRLLAAARGLRARLN